MLSGQISLKDEHRSALDRLTRNYLRSGKRAVELAITDRALPVSGRALLRGMLTIKTDKPRRQAAAPTFDKAPSTEKATAANITARRLERNALAEDARKLAASGVTRKCAAFDLDISLGTLRRITQENHIAFARDRKAPAKH
ncbi:MAG: hypothetical protein ACRES0_28025 [Pseudomonas sp.]